LDHAGLVGQNRRKMWHIAILSFQWAIWPS